MATGNNKNSLLASQARELFVAHASGVLPDLAKTLLETLSAMRDLPRSTPGLQARRDGWLAFRDGNAAWVAQTTQAWKKPLSVTPASKAASGIPFNRGSLELVGEEVMEHKILSSRLTLRMLDFVNWELNDLRLRIQSLEGIPELAKGDILRPEVVAEKLVEHWIGVGLTRELWMTVQEVIQNRLAEHLLEAYHAANEYLVKNGVMAEIDLRPLVKLTPSGVAGEQTPATRQSGKLAGSENSNAASRHSPHEETRMQTGTSPLARARSRAQGVIGNLKRMLSNHVAGFDDTRSSQASPQLAQAIAAAAYGGSDAQATVLAGGSEVVYGEVHVEQVVSALRQQSSKLKRAASTEIEKATIEVVALMFQAILAEDRIPPTIRVWFARLQMPVLRVAISEPEFFGSLQHPARRLIDRMGSCVLGFDADVSGSAMEMEIKRVVQVIEQYPETGRRVFQLVYDEFQKFLAKFLSEQGSTAHVVSIAQQVEQKETLAIQYTIEMRSMLNDMPVRDEIREFLFKVWAEVLAMAAMRNGPQHEETQRLRRAAADLVWAASAKPNRADRSKVIADLPKLLQLLRLGMSMLGQDLKTQDGHIKLISDTLADAFMSKTDAISTERIDAMAKRLANLEDYLSDEDVGDLPLDTESLVMMIGINASDIEVITDGGSQPTEAMRAWAQELQLGAWFTLDHNGKVTHVQFAWCSERKQLHLFASSDGRNFLIQARRLAAYLQAGLLVPTEEEALTVRATRDALAKLDANPERLLG